MVYSLRTLVEVRANGRCEYCRRPQDLVGETFFEIDHILPQALGGPTTPDNLAFACRRCNLLKGSATAAIDPQTGQLAPLFHPRRDPWVEHFERSADLLQILGRTATGRTTVLLLRLNSESEQRARAIQRDYLALLFPLD
jgi:hypothetical protein